MKETQKKLLQSAIQEFAEWGYEKTNVNRVADAAELSVGTLYNYFPTKRDLMYAVIDHVSHLHVTYIVDHVVEKEDPVQRVEAFFEAGFGFVESNHTQAKAIFNTLNGPDDEFKNRLFNTYQPLFELLGSEIIILGVSQGVFQSADPSRTASLIMFIYLGTGSQFDHEGKLWMEPEEVSKFVLNSLRYKEKEG